MTMRDQMTFDPGQELFYEPLASDEPPFVHLPLEEYAGQDINDPVWPSMPVEAPATDHRPADTGVRAHGGLDFLQDVVEETLEDMLYRETSHGPAHKHRAAPIRPMVVQTFEPSAHSWRGVTYSVDQEKRIVEARADRKRVIVFNQSNAVIFVSHETGALGGQNFIAIPANTSPNNFRTFYTQGEIWAYPNVLGTPQTVDIQDEYGVPEL